MPQPSHSSAVLPLGSQCWAAVPHVKATSWHTLPSLAGTDIAPIVPALEKIWRDSKGQSLADFNFRTVTSKFNELVYQYPIRCACFVLGVWSIFSAPLQHQPSCQGWHAGMHAAATLFCCPQASS